MTDSVRNEEVLHRVQEERNIPHALKRRKANWIGHIMHGHCLQKHIAEGKVKGGIEMPVDVTEMKGYSKLKAIALDRAVQEATDLS